MLDFSADASEGPIRAYLLDVADTEEQDMALNIHAFSAGKTHDLVSEAAVFFLKVSRLQHVSSFQH